MKKMLGSRQATPEQVARLYDLAAESKTGKFGMPVNNVDPSKGLQIDTYHLATVRDLPYGFVGDENDLADPNVSLADVSGTYGANYYRARLFWPSLEVAAGLRSQGHSIASTELQELSAIGRQWSDPLYRTRQIREFGHPLSDSETAPLEEHQSFDSAYAASVGKYALNFYIRAMTNLGKENVSEWYAVEYDMSKQPPQDHRSRPSYSLRDPSYTAEVSLWPGDSRRVRLERSRHVDKLGPFSISNSARALRRGEAELIAADLEQVKDVYAQWS